MTYHATAPSRRALLAAAAAAGLVALPFSAALADDVADFYSGRTVTIYVGFGPGGGYDLYARLAADFIGDHIPGNPDVIVENMPGAGGRLAAQHLYNRAAQDGTAMGLIVQSVAMDSATGEIPGGVDAADFNAIGRLTANYELGLVWHTSDVTSFEDARAREVSFASTGAGSASFFVPMMLNEIEGTQFRVIAGYQGAAAARLAVEQGETDAFMTGLAGLRVSNPDWLENELVRPIWQLAIEPHPDYPDVPAVGQMGQTDAERAMLQLVAGAAEVGRSLLAPPNVPAERVEALRRAFDAMIEDPAFLDAAAERNHEIDTLTGEELQEVLLAQMAVDDEVIEMVRRHVSAQ